jgi:hypothetical protein
VAAARVGGSQGTPAAGLRPRPAREKGSPSNLLLDHLLSLNREDYLTPKQGLDLIPNITSLPIRPSTPDITSPFSEQLVLELQHGHLDKDSTPHKLMT